jgi:toxin ParE1/3/4
MAIRWSPEAFEDLKILQAYIAENNSAASIKMVRRILEAVEQLLSSNPDMGRPGRVSGTRELVVANTPYVVPYRVRNNQVEIIRVYHAAQKWPERL